MSVTFQNGRVLSIEPHFFSSQQQRENILTQTVGGLRSRLFSVASTAEVGFDDAFVLAQGGAVAFDDDLAGLQDVAVVRQL